MFQANNAMGGAPKTIKKDWGLGGVLIMQDAPDGKKAGTMLWGGLPNLIWVSPSFHFRFLFRHMVLPTDEVLLDVGAVKLSVND